MATFFTVFGLSFLTALSGALQPGPLLTYTIAQTLRTRQHGWLTGARVIAGHAAIEAVLIVGLILGLAALLTNKITVWIIGSVGFAAYLLYSTFSYTG
jgi:threonine/homoserine/homoserine lactone efflux protein